MQFCNNCGTKIESVNTNFCPVCGKSLTGRVVTPVYNGVSNLSQTTNVRKSSLMILANAIQYFSKKGEQYNEYFRLLSLIQRYQKSSGAFLIWGIILMSFGGSFCIFSIVSHGDIVWRIILLTLVGLGVLFIIAYIIKEISRKKQLKGFLSRQQELDEELMYYYQQFPERIYIGPEYTAPDFLATLLNLVRSGRADTIKDAINIFLRDQQFAQFNNTQQQILQAVQAAANSASTAATFAGLHFFIR